MVSFPFSTLSGKSSELRLAALLLDRLTFVFNRSKPLQIWDQNVRNGHIKRITDPDIASSVLEIMGTNVSTNFITCPLDPKKTLAIKLPFLVMIIKNVSRLLADWRCSMGLSEFI